MSSMSLRSEVNRREFWTWWLGAGVVAFTLATVVDSTTKGQGIILGGVGYAVLILPMLAQWFVLRRFLPNLGGLRWVVRSIVGQVIGSVLGIVVLLAAMVIVTIPTGLTMHDMLTNPLYSYLLTMPVVVLIGGAQAYAQWKILQRYFPQGTARLWVVANLISSLVTATLFSLGILLPLEPHLRDGLAAMVGAALGALITGLAILNLMDERQAELAELAAVPAYSARRIYASQPKRARKKKH